MARSLSLAAYRAYVKRGPVPDYTPVRPRPKGELVWAHATSPTRLVALVDLTGRLAAQRGAITILITYDPALVSQKRIDKLTISQK
jgi:3-deoxy-D-manno-octulosonic-acid transferase